MSKQKSKPIVSEKKLKNPHGFTINQIKRIIQDIEVLRDLDEALAVDLIKFVVEGEENDSLLKLSGLAGAKDVLEPLRNRWSNRKLFNIRKEILVKGSVKNPAWHRLGEFYATIYRLHKAPIRKDWPNWASALITEYLGTEGKTFQAAAFADLMSDYGADPDLLIDACLTEGISKHYYRDKERDQFNDWKTYLKDRMPLVRHRLEASDAADKVEHLNWLHKSQIDVSSLLEMLVTFGTGTASTVRRAAQLLLEVHKSAARPLIEKTLKEGKAAQRLEAAQLLWQIYQNDATEALEKHLEDESSNRVKQTVERMISTIEDLEDPAAMSAMTLAIDLPPVDVNVGEVKLDTSFHGKLEKAYQKLHENAEREYEREMKRYESDDRPSWMRKPKKPEAIKKDHVKQMISYLETGKTPKNFKSHEYNRELSLNDAASAEDFELIHLVRLDWLQNSLRRQGDGTIFYQSNELDRYRNQCKQPFGLRELALVMNDLDIKPEMLAHSWLKYFNGWSPFCEWEDEAIWPLFIENLEVIKTALKPKTDSQDYWYNETQQAAFHVISIMPEIPPTFIPLLWNVALGEGKTNRELAQKGLATIPNKTEKIISALTDGKQAIRGAAAKWLGELGDTAALEPLKKAFKKEKQEIVKGVMIHALEVLGADVNEFLDRKQLAKDAEKGLSKKLPKGMEWVPLDRLPEVHWEDTGKRVDTAILKWWIVQGVKEKSAAPSPLLRKYLSFCKKEDVEQFARFVLDSWIGYDTQTISREQAEAKASVEAKRWAQHYGTEQEHYKTLLAEYLSTCLNSASGQKGMLQIAAAGGERSVAKSCEKYIRHWYGQRMSQCKGLLEVLAWNDDPLAVQILLSISKRFRTKSIQQAAQEYVEVLAERSGWTVDELADRTIPDGGIARPLDENDKPILGEQAKLELDFGPRKFVVTLDDDLKPVITNEDGKTVKNLPKPGKNDDEELAKEAKKAFSAAKKTVKEVVKQQTERLYEGLCTQRSWPYEDWRRYLAEHPIVGPMCTRLIWAAFENFDKETGPYGELGFFRPLEDGTLTDEKDDEITLPSTCYIQVAHASNCSKDQAQAWQSHLDDYDIQQPFQQFGREIYELSEAKQDAQEIEDFTGYMISTFKLRSVLNKLGYVRGDAEDGGGFYIYRKLYPTLQLQAVIEFTGSYVPEEDLPGALKELYFSRYQSGSDSSTWNMKRMALKRVPSVLLSESYNDMKQAAEAGTGFDKAWESKSYF